MKRYNVTVGYMVPHFHLEIEADNAEEAQRLAIVELSQDWEPSMLFECEELK